MKKVLTLGFFVLFGTSFAFGMRREVDARGLSLTNLYTLKFVSGGVGTIALAILLDNVRSNACYSQLCLPWGAFALASFTITAFAEAAEQAQRNYNQNQRCISRIKPTCDRPSTKALEYRRSHQN